MGSFPEHEGDNGGQREHDARKDKALFLVPVARGPDHGGDDRKGNGNGMGSQDIQGAPSLLEQIGIAGEKHAEQGPQTLRQRRVLRGGLQDLLSQTEADQTFPQEEEPGVLGVLKIPGAQEQGQLVLAGGGGIGAEGGAIAALVAQGVQMQDLEGAVLQPEGDVGPVGADASGPAL